ncbi:MAG: hypothetical protein Fur0021_23850 [Candidatus Promineifilaceae bacterium]
MSWQRYDLVFRLLSPLHIGWRKTSNLQQTRGYVTAKVFWAALTAHLTRETTPKAGSQVYQKIGEQIKAFFRFGYLYPALQTDSQYQCHYPWEEDFDYLFLGSYASTALNYDSFSAEDGMLHETEFIAPRTRTGEQVFLKGDLYVQDDLPDSLAAWRQVMPRLQFGAERGYGWGQVQLITALQGMPAEPIAAPVNGHILAHLHHNRQAQGAIEPLIGWERNNDDGWRLSDSVIAYAPGAIVNKEESFQIAPDGFWQ